MPTLIVMGKDCGMYIVDGDCAYEVKSRDVLFFADFEFMYDLLSEDIKKNISDGYEHCDAIRISVRNRTIIVDIFELSMNKKRDLADYFRKHYFCVKFVDYLLGKDMGKGVRVRTNNNEVEVDTIKINPFIVANSDVARDLEKEAKKIDPGHYFREILSKYPIGRPVVVECQKLS
ncbi:hypothetical protein [Metallosphaera hakonensis]|nr:hypothetical protein [Metallosphaera hakonensis]